MAACVGLGSINSSVAAFCHPLHVLTFLLFSLFLQVTTYDRLRTGWFSVLVTSYPDKIHEALAASLQVLRELAVSHVTPRELMRAKRTLLTR